MSLPPWNYDKQGTDWAFSSCNETNLKNSSSPRNLNDVTEGVKKIYDWHAYQYAFIPKYHPVLIDVAGEKDFVYQITLKDESASKGFTGFWGSEPFPNPV